MKDDVLSTRSYPLCLIYYLYVAERGGIKCDRIVGADRYTVMCKGAKKESKKKNYLYASRNMLATTYTRGYRLRCTG